MKCPSCGGEVLQGMPMCPRCGQRFAPQSQRGKYCVHCKAVIPANAVVCPKCGKPQAQQQAAQQPAKVKKPGGFRWWYVPIMVLLVMVGYAIGAGSAPEVQTKDAGKAKTSSSSSQASKSSKESSSETKDSQVSEPAESEELYKITYQKCNLYSDSSGDTRCDIIIEIENTCNKDLYLGSPVYDFEDPSGKLIGTSDFQVFGSSDPDIIAPGEKGYFYANNGTVDGEITPDMDYVFVPKLKVQESRKKIVRYDLSDISMVEGSPCLFTGRITNNTNEDDGLVWISFVLFDSDNKPLAVYGTSVLELTAGSTLSFSANASLIHGVSFEDIASYKAFACKTQYQ